MRKGFTLIELIVVIAIIAILAAIIAPNAFKAIEKGKISATIGDYRAIKTAAMSFYADTGVWPGDGVTTRGFITDDDGSGNAVSGWDGPYLEKWPPRANWGGAYTFQKDSAFNWDGVAGGDAARYVQITNVPRSAALKIDIQLDGMPINNPSPFNQGGVRYVEPTLYILISCD